MRGAMQGLKGEGRFERATYTRGAASHAKRLRREMPISERKLWEALRKLKLNIRRQVPIGRYIADFAHLGSRLLVEVDGVRHDLPEAQLHDAERDAWLKGQGYRILRIPSDRAFACPWDVAEEVKAAIRTLPPRGGEGRVGGVAAEPGREAVLARAPTSASARTAPATPPSPALPPSRGKGE